MMLFCLPKMGKGQPEGGPFALILGFAYPSATSSIIITRKPAMTPSVPE